jgi:DNA-binding transcriptional LysR family regulator
LELRQLRAFLRVADSRHFGRAAADLRITQPALTQRIQALERELGVQLLERSAREVRLTSAGEVLLPYASSLVQVEDRALRDLADNVAGRTGRLRIGYLLNGDVVTQGKIVGEFRHRYPDVIVETNQASSITNLAHLRAGAVDAAFLGPLKVPSDVSLRPAGRRAVMLALPQEHPLAQHARIPVTSLRRVPIIMWPGSWNPDLTATFTQWLTRNIGAEPNVIAEEPADQAFEAVVRSGSAVTLASSWRASAPMAARGIVFRRLQPEPIVEHHIAFLRDDPSPVLQHLLRITEEVVAADPANESDESELL